MNQAKETEESKRGKTQDFCQKLKPQVL